MNNELGRIWKEEVVAYSRYYSGILPGETEGNQKRRQSGLSMSWPRFKLGILTDNSMTMDIYSKIETRSGVQKI
jgi:hypothetical protein